MTTNDQQNFFNEIVKEIPWHKDTLRLKTGKIARQADGAVIVELGGTTLLCTVCFERYTREGVNFLPLTVNYREMHFSVGKIPTGFVKRESKATDQEVLFSRLIDRAIRPLFPEGFWYETQIICTLLSYDWTHTPDTLAIIGAAAALSISGLPIKHTTAAVKVGYVNGDLILNPTKTEMQNSSLKLVASGIESVITMIESEADNVNDNIIVDALAFAHKHIKSMVKEIDQFAEMVGRPIINLPIFSNSKLLDMIYNQYGNKIRNTLNIKDKHERRLDFKMLGKELINSHKEISPIEINHALEKIQTYILCSQIFENNTRLDGRRLDEIRPINAEVGWLPKTHGSALFTRGQTQSMSTITLGTETDAQIVEGLESEIREHFFLHYIFPQYAVGEVGMMKAPARREIGHGRLALNGLKHIMPDKNKFSYTVRAVSEISESNGSSSMATVCGVCLALMDGGVPITDVVSGIAMGAIVKPQNVADIEYIDKIDHKECIIISDITGDEDAFGDGFDLKVIGSKTGITALQLDVKTIGITNIELLSATLAQAKIGIKHIIDEMQKAISKPREELSSNAPITKTLKIDKDKIRDIIGTGGRVVREISSSTSCQIEIDPEGLLKIYGPNQEKVEAAIVKINKIIQPQHQHKIKDLIQGKITKVIESGAFMNYGNNLEGFIHISEICEERVNNIADYLRSGMSVKATVIGFDLKNKPKLSLKGQNIVKQNVDTTRKNGIISEKKYFS